MTKIQNINESGYNKIGGYAYPFVIRNGWKKGLAAVLTVASLAGAPAVMLTGCDNGMEQTAPNKDTDELLKEIKKTNPNFNVDTHNQSVRGFSYNGFGAIKTQPVSTCSPRMPDSRGLAAEYTTAYASTFAKQSIEIMNIFKDWKKDLPQNATKSHDFADNIINNEAYLGRGSAGMINGVAMRNNLDRGCGGEGGMNEKIKTFFSGEAGFNANLFDKQMQAYQLACYVNRKVNVDNGTTPKQAELDDIGLRRAIYDNGNGIFISKGDAKQAKAALEQMFSDFIPKCLLQQIANIEEFGAWVDGVRELGLSPSDWSR